MNESFSQRTKNLIDGLKKTCASYGLGNDGNEFKIVTQAFLYKFLNDKFTREIKAIDTKLAESQNWEQALADYSDNEYKLLLARLPAGSAKLEPHHFISYLFSQQNEPEFAQLFDDTLRDISLKNSAVFSVETEDKSQIRLFDDELSNYIANKSQRNNFTKAIINQLIEFSFEDMFDEGFDFFSTIFEYMIKDYNKDGGTKYAEYYTPHAISKVMAKLLIPSGASNVTAYDPAAGSGMLLMNLAHALGSDNATIYSQDISQKSTSLLRLNLILNNLTHSIHNITQGNTLTHPAHPERTYDFVISNPPFKLDFSDDQPALMATDNASRFFAGVPKIPKKNKSSMAIYQLFIQHILHSLNTHGRAAIVVPSGFCTDTASIPDTIRRHLIDNHYLQGVVHFPSNVFANTNTSVSVIFIDKSKKNEQVMFVDASRLGESIKETDLTKTILSEAELSKIIDTYLSQTDIAEFSTLVAVDRIKESGYAIKTGLYFAIDNDSLLKIKRDMQHEHTRYLQRQAGLKNMLTDRMFRNLFITEIIDTKTAHEDGLEYPTINTLLESAIGGEWGKESPEKKYSESVRCIRGTDIPNIRLSWYDEVPTRYVKDEHIQTKSLKAHDIVIEISGGSPIQSTGRICLITDSTLADLDSPVVCSNFCRVLRFKDPSIAPYVYQYLQLLYEKGYMFNLENNTTGIKNLIFPAFINNIHVPIPKNKEEIYRMYSNIEEETAKLLNT